MRKTQEELEQLKKKYNVNQLYSWSKINCYNTSKYEYFLKYILKEKPDRKDCIYTFMGSGCHDILERLYEKKIDYKDMEDEYDMLVTTSMVSDYKFDRNNEEKNKSISDRYYANLECFFRNHSIIPYKVIVEQFIDINIDGNILIGYIDCVYKDNDGNYNIIDFKTSSIYKGEKAEKECGQLLLYALGLNQKGIPFEKIKIAWNFLKYVNVTYIQQNGKPKTRTVERSKLGESLFTATKTFLKKAGYNETEISTYLDTLSYTNNLDCLPKEIQKKFTLEDSYVYVDISENLINKLKSKILKAIKETTEKEKQYYETNESNRLEVGKELFWETFDEVKENDYYYATLCEYSPNLLLPYKAYLEDLEIKKDGNVFYEGGNKPIEEDLSWLDEL